MAVRQRRMEAVSQPALMSSSPWLYDKGGWRLFCSLLWWVPHLGCTAEEDGGSLAACFDEFLTLAVRLRRMEAVLQLALMSSSPWLYDRGGWRLSRSLLWWVPPPVPRTHPQKWTWPGTGTAGDAQTLPPGPPARIGILIKNYVLPYLQIWRFFGNSAFWLVAMIIW